MSNLFIRQFSHDSITGTVKKWNPKACEFDEALYTQALIKIYGDPLREIAKTFVPQQNAQGDTDLNVDLGKLDASAASALTIFNRITEFARLAAHVIKLDGLGFPWPKSTFQPADIDLAFRHYLEDEMDIWGYIALLVEELDRPNTVAGAPLEALTAAERADPLSSSSASSGGAI